MGLFTERQYKTLIDKISEGRLIDNMYDIGKYLICNRDGKTWTKDPDAGKFRENIIRMMGDVENSFRKNGYRFYR